MKCLRSPPTMILEGRYVSTTPCSSPSSTFLHNLDLQVFSISSLGLPPFVLSPFMNGASYCIALERDVGHERTNAERCLTKTFPIQAVSIIHSNGANTYGFARFRTRTEQDPIQRAPS